MSNPVFSRSPIFNPKPGEKVEYASFDTRRPTGTDAADPATLDALYGAPSATTADTGRLTYDDVIVKTGGLLALLVVVGALTWTLAPELFFIGAIVGLVLGLVNAFKRTPSPALIVAYTVAQGVFLGGISSIFESRYEGIVLQAVVATVATFAVSLFLYRSGKVRVTPKFTRWLLMALVGYAAFSLLNLLFMIFAGSESGWGWRGDVTIAGIPLGVIVGIVAVGLAAATLIMDFDTIQRGVVAGVPAKFAWSAAFGLIVTLVWLYLEFLRLLAILRGND